MDQTDSWQVDPCQTFPGYDLPWIKLIHGRLFAMDQFDPWQVVPRQVFTPCSLLLISTVFVVVSHVCCNRGNWCVKWDFMGSCILL